MGTQSICSIPDCGKAIKSRGLCNTHYAQKWRKAQPRCAANGCQNASVSRGLCDSHYRKRLEQDGRIIARPGETLPCSVPNCKRPHSAFGYCEPHYARFKRHGSPTAGISDRGAGLAFVAKVLAMPPTDECIIWHVPYRGKNRRGGYPHINVDGRGWPAHRYVCLQAHGPEPKPNMETCHSCDNKRCVNPKHLRWGTPADNAADRVLRGTLARGEQQWSAKLTSEQVRQIKALLPVSTDRQLGQQFGVTPENISFIRKGKAWRHITLEDVSPSSPPTIGQFRPQASPRTR